MQNLNDTAGIDYSLVIGDRVSFNSGGNLYEGSVLGYRSENGRIYCHLTLAEVGELLVPASDCKKLTKH